MKIYMIVSVKENILKQQMPGLANLCLTSRIQDIGKQGRHSSDAIRVYTVCVRLIDNSPERTRWTIKKAELGF